VTTPSVRLAGLGLELPPVAAPLASYVPATSSAGLVLTSGQLPTVAGRLVAPGRVGATVALAAAGSAARPAALNGLAAAASVVGGLDHIARIVKVTVFVASASDFTAQAQVANGASDLLGEVFGESGRHVRSAVGVAVLPLDAPVEVELTVEPVGAPG